MIWTVYDATGHFKMRFSGTEANFWLNVDADTDQIFTGEHDPHTTYAEAGEVKTRPATGLPHAHSLPANTDWTVPDVPEGAEVWIDGALAGVTDADGLTLTFPEARAWRVELRPPWPWQDARCEVTAQ